MSFPVKHHVEHTIPIRSALFVPGNRPDRVDKAVKSEADVVIIDLEDSVPLSDKSSTRSLVRKKIHEHRAKRIMVRVNALGTDFVYDDLNEVITENVWGLMVPKVDEAARVREIHRMVFDMERKKKLLPGSILLFPLVENARAVENIYEIVTQNIDPRRVVTAAFGAADYALDMGITLTNTGEELEYPRARIAVACRAAGVGPPLDTPFMTDLKDLAALERDAMRAKRLGFGGKLCIHPLQIEIVNRVFSPTEEEIANARKVMDAFRKAEKEGRAAVQIDGRFVDYPVFENSKRILDIAEHMKA